MWIFKLSTMVLCVSSHKLFVACFNLQHLEHPHLLHYFGNKLKENILNLLTRTRWVIGNIMTVVNFFYCFSIEWNGCCTVVTAISFAFEIQLSVVTTVIVIFSAMLTRVQMKSSIDVFFSMLVPSLASLIAWRVWSRFILVLKRLCVGWLLLAHHLSPRNCSSCGTMLRDGSTSRSKMGSSPQLLIISLDRTNSHDPQLRKMKTSVTCPLELSIQDVSSSLPIKYRLVCAAVHSGTSENGHCRILTFF